MKEEIKPWQLILLIAVSGTLLGLLPVGLPWLFAVLRDL